MRRAFVVLTSLVLALASVALPAGAAVDRAQPLPVEDQQQVYEAEVTPDQLTRLVQEGFDIPSREPRSERVLVDLVLSARERRRVEDLGVALTEQVNEFGYTATEYARLQHQQGYEVWRDYSGPGGFAEEMRALTATFPDITQLEVIGQSVLGQDILAVRVTADAAGTEVGSRPAVLYNATQHAREWIAAEVDFRLLQHVVNNYGTDADITRIVDTTELWFVPVVNVDGYDFTFTEGNRLWRKNLRDNNGDGQITGVDGVDLNRNWPEKWGYDNEGSSPDPADNTYRGTGPASEPETQALLGLMERVGFEFQLDYHSYGPLLLYPYGWQENTETADDPIFDALSGTDLEPAVEGYDPDLAAELYITNGSVDDYAYFEQDILVWTPELNEGCEGCGFEFPDDEALVQAEFERNLQFALDLARSAPDPANPVSHLGNTTPDFELDPFAVSYGDPQTVQVNAKRELGPVVMRYRINGGRARFARTSEYQGGERYHQDDDLYYHRLRGQVRGTRPGDEVTVFFQAFRRGRGLVTSDQFTYTVASDTEDPVLVVAAEDYTGISPPPETGTAAPRYAGYYADALEAAGYASDVYDVDANGRTAPHPLGVLSHYDAVVIETGDDIITESQGQGPGTVALLARDLQLTARDYLNDGGKLLYAGAYAGFASGANGYVYNPGPPDSVAEGECPVATEPYCLTLSNDFLQYWLGAYAYNAGAGIDPGTEEPFDLVGTAPPFEGSAYTFTGGDGVDNQTNAASFLPTSDFLPPEQFPQFASSAPLDWARPGGAPFEPLTGEYFAASQQDDESYKRLTQTVDLTGLAAPAESGTALLEFSASYDIEPAWDFLFVEAHPAGSDEWTTLPATDAESGAPITTQDTGESCPADWRTVHPFLDHYQTLNADGTCTPTGTTGEWHAATGNSAGWQRWSVDLSAYAGQQVEVSVTYVSDFAVQGLGVFVDDASVVVGGEVVSTTSFEEDLGGWAVPGPPEGSPPNDNDWIRTQALFDEGAATTTDDTVYLGFGVEGLATFAERTDLLGRAVGYLLAED
jgi:hypothetical protein